MTRRIWSVILLVAALSVGARADQPRYFKLTILHTNDLHTHLLKYSDPRFGDVGAAAARAALVTSLREQTRNPILLVDCGDGTIYSGKDDTLGHYYRGSALISSLNAMGYDAMGPGNHEFQLSYKDAMRNESESFFPWICANLIRKDTGLLVFKPYQIREYNGVRVGLLGLITTLTEKYAGAKELKVTDYVEAANRYVPEIRKKADVVIVLSHLGYREDRKLAAAVPGIDAIIGGHTHSVLRAPVLISHGDPGPFDLNATIIVQAGSWDRFLGDLDLIFRGDEAGRYHLMSKSGKIIPITKEMPEDPAVADMLQKMLDAIPKK